MNTAKQIKALVLLNELQSLLLEDERSNTDGGCLPPEADAYVGPGLTLWPFSFALGWRRGVLQECTGLLLLFYGHRLQFYVQRPHDFCNRLITRL